MKSVFLRCGLPLFLLAALLCGWGTTAGRAFWQDDGVKRITKEELSGLLNNKGKKGGAFVVDVRDANLFKAGHIKGAVNIPYGEVEKRIKEFPKNRLIVFYCS